MRVSQAVALLCVVAAGGLLFRGLRQHKSVCIQPVEEREEHEQETQEQEET